MKPSHTLLITGTPIGVLTLDYIENKYKNHEHFESCKRFNKQAFIVCFKQPIENCVGLDEDFHRTEINGKKVLMLIRGLTRPIFFQGIRSDVSEVTIRAPK